MFRYSAHDDADTLNLFDEGFQGRTALSLFTVNALSQLPSVDMNWTNRYKARKPGGGGDSQKNWVGVCGPLPKTLTLFMTKICDFPYPIYDLTKNLIPYL